MATWDVVYEDLFNRTGLFNGSISTSGHLCVDPTVGLNALACNGADLTVGTSGVGVLVGDGDVEAPVPSNSRARVSFTCSTNTPSLNLRLFTVQLRNAANTQLFGATLEWLNSSGMRVRVYDGAGLGATMTAYVPMSIATFAAMPHTVVIGYENEDSVLTVDVDGSNVFSAVKTPEDMTGWKPYLSIRTGNGQDTFIYNALVEQQSAPSGFWTQFVRTVEVN